ncbi:MAG: RNB domain-containing ribonuclease, partial [Actinomycetota bacterium]|nr:RNB domain-containing ribonuclease [Actinomycetota bacterium]
MKALLRRAPGSFVEGFERVREELRVPKDFPPEVLAAAEAAEPIPTDRRDRTDVGFVAIDPPGAADLDQAFFAEATPDGYRVLYAIADLGAFVTPGGPVDVEARKRGTTLYSPDLRTPLLPPVISEDRASLLARTLKPALVWELELDGEGVCVRSHLERSTVRVREAISYREAQRRIDAGDAFLALLRTIGTLRQEREAERGGVSLNLPAQEIIEVDDSYQLAYDETLPVEGWNAQISLLAGMVAGQTMVDAGVGILRTLPPTSQQNLDQLRQQAGALDVAWPTDLSYPDLVRYLRPDIPRHSAFLLQAARSFRGAGYVSIASALAASPSDDGKPVTLTHGAIGALYAHVTAPLRRLVDRFANEILLSLYAGETPPSWATEALDELPGLMGKARSRESNLERTLLDFAEAMVLEPLVGHRVRGTVVSLDQARSVATVQIAETAIVASISTEHGPAPALADELDLVVHAADPVTRTI